MHDTRMKGVVRYLRTVAGGRPTAEATDHQLLLQFAARGDQAAFAAVVERYGPMVLRVCRRVLRQEQDAEDAFQATFLVLARKAGSIRKSEALASWLHGVAYRVALRAKRDAGRRRLREREVQPMPTKAREIDWRDVQAALDQAIQALPEKYRTPFILCFLDGKSRADVARELGLKEGTVWSRLSQARKLLQERLSRRGITLSALLAGAALAGGMTNNVSARLIQATVQAASAASTAPAQVAALARGVSETMSMTRFKTLLLCLVTAGLVAFGAGAVLHGNAAAQKPPEKAAGTTLLVSVPSSPAIEKPRAEEKQAAALEDAGETVTFRARVLDPEGKPLPGAQVTLWWHFGYEGYYREWHPDTTATLTPKSVAASGEDGRFTAEYGKAEIRDNPFNMWNRPWRLVQVVAAAKGYGPAWASLESFDKGAPVLRLVKDDMPVRGRVLDLEGRPVPDAAVRVVRVTVGDDVHNSLWQPYWTGLSADVKTDRDGRFSLSGVGRGRSVLLSIQGPGIEHKLVTARTPAVDERAASPEVEVVAGPTKPVEGTVVARGTGKPLAGVVVYGNEGAHHRLVRAVTDERGHYRLLGLPKGNTYQVTAYPSVDTGYLDAGVRTVDTEGLRPIRADFELRHGIEVRCRFIDKETRKPIRGELRYTPLEANPLVGEAEIEPGFRPTRTFFRVYVPGPDGVIRLVVYPGLGVLTGNLQGNAQRYLPLPLDPADLAKSGGELRHTYAGLTGVYRLIEPKEGDRPLEVDIELTPAPKQGGKANPGTGKEEGSKHD